MGKHINSSSGMDIDPIICKSHFKVKCSRSNKQGKEFNLCLATQGQVIPAVVEIEADHTGSSFRCMLSSWCDL